jgi:hypothetical protein
MQNDTKLCKFEKNLKNKISLTEDALKHNSKVSKASLPRW